MKHTYEKPMAVTVAFEATDILTLSSPDDGIGDLKSISWGDITFE